jgi:hypothetical protein
MLFARTVELERGEEEQALALTLLLRLSQGDAELFSQLVDHHKLLLQALEAPKCIAGVHLLKSFLDACTDRTLLPLQPPSTDVAVCHVSDAIVVNAFLLVTTVRAWRAWHAHALSTLFRVLHALLRDDHPYREFNAFQMNRLVVVINFSVNVGLKFLLDILKQIIIPWYILTIITRILGSVWWKPFSCSARKSCCTPREKWDEA